MSQFAMITETGLNEIDNAHPLGQYIEIAYYLPVYDFRIDETISPTSAVFSATEISSVTTSADVVPSGEILWNLSGSDIYTLSTDRTYLVRTDDEVISSSGTGKEITNYAHSDTFGINQFNSSAVSDYYTADTVLSPGTLGSGWFFSNAGYELLSAPSSAVGFGPESHEEPEQQFLYRGVTYQHVIASDDDSRANFKITMRLQSGEIRFNKIGLYAVKRSADGLIIADPFLFGQVIIPEPQILQAKSINNNNIGLTELTLDFQIDSKAVTSGVFEDVFYSTSADYWVRTTNESNGIYGLTYDGSVYVTNTLGVDETGGILSPDADRSISKLLVSTFEHINQPVVSAETNMPQLALQYVASQGIESNRIRTTFRTNSIGDCEIDMYGACTSAERDKHSIIPVVDKEFGLGLSLYDRSHSSVEGLSINI